MIPGDNGPHGVNMERQPQRRERTGIFQIIGIGLVLAVALWGALALLGDTRSTWEQQRADRNAQVARMRELAASGARTGEQDQRALQEAQQRAIATAQERQRADVAAGRLRCVNGLLFRRLDNGWENIPGRRCHSE